MTRTEVTGRSAPVRGLLVGREFELQWHGSTRRVSPVASNGAKVDPTSADETFVSLVVAICLGSHGHVEATPK
jgi:hypothetical protein